MRLVHLLFYFIVFWDLLMSKFTMGTISSQVTMWNRESTEHNKGYEFIGELIAI